MSPRITPVLHTQGVARAVSGCRMTSMQQGALVLTEDGYYGIVVGRRDIFLGNGLQEVLDDRAWEALRPLPINVNHEGGVCNFRELLERSGR